MVKSLQTDLTTSILFVQCLQLYFHLNIYNRKVIIITVRINLFPLKHSFLATIIYFLFSIAFNCGKLSPPTNGQLQLYNSTTVTYTCDTDYILHGASTRRCTASAEWSGSVPQCIRELRATKLHQIDPTYTQVNGQIDKKMPN